MNSKKKYIAPTLRVSSYQAEKGYAVSLWFIQDQEQNNMEMWEWSSNEEENRFGGEWDNGWTY